MARRNSALKRPRPSALGRRHRLGIVEARRRVERLPAAHEPEERGAHRVDVGPRPLAAAARVLLDGAVAGRHHQADLGSSRWRSGARRRSRAARGCRPVAHVDVVGLDVAVQVARAVDDLQAIEQRRQQRHDCRLGNVLVVLAERLERLAALVLEHHVRGLVRLEESRHAHDVAVAERRERARFHEEAVQPALVELLVEVVARGDGVVLRAVGELLRQVFLDDDLRGEVHVGGRVSDAEAALAEHGVDAVFEEPVARGQHEGRGRGFRIEDAARIVRRRERRRRSRSCSIRLAGASPAAFWLSAISPPRLPFVAPPSRTRQSTTRGPCGFKENP